MTTTATVYIAGSKTADDWKEFRATLVPGGSRETWETAFRDYFYERLSLRYLNPIKVLQEYGTFQGEGFSIMAIQCSLIEFLESTLQGLSYRYLRKGQTLGPYEYANSKDIFLAFLCNRQPFDRAFTTTIAEDFYEGVRCGLLHEARTKNGWRIWAEGRQGSIIDASTKTVYRNNFQVALLAFVEWYKEALPLQVALQGAFIRKFDSLCQ